jgi:hypothetical protein
MCACKPSTENSTCAGASNSHTGRTDPPGQATALWAARVTRSISRSSRHLGPEKIGGQAWADKLDHGGVEFGRFVDNAPELSPPPAAHTTLQAHHTCALDHELLGRVRRRANLLQFRLIRQLRADLDSY